ncbi:MAG: type II secretion system F family protein [Fidelibacterota bacterium]
MIRHFMEGRTFSDLVSQIDILEPEYTHIIAISENTGNLTSAFRHIRDTVTSEFESRLEGLSSLLEPVIVVGLGLIVGLILVGMYLPLFELSSTAAF